MELISLDGKGRRKEPTLEKLKGGTPSSHHSTGGAQLAFSHRVAPSRRKAHRKAKLLAETKNERLRHVPHPHEKLVAQT
jgi:hypothetical protein